MKNLAKDTRKNIFENDFSAVLRNTTGMRMPETCSEYGGTFLTKQRKMKKVRYFACFL